MDNDTQKSKKAKRKNVRDAYAASKTYQDRESLSKTSERKAKTGVERFKLTDTASKKGRSVQAESEEVDTEEYDAVEEESCAEKLQVQHTPAEDDTLSVKVQEQPASTRNSKQAPAVSFPEGSAASPTKKARAKDSSNCDGVADKIAFEPEQEQPAIVLDSVEVETVNSLGRAVLCQVRTDSAVESDQCGSIVEARVYEKVEDEQAADKSEAADIANALAVEVGASQTEDRAEGMIDGYNEATTDPAGATIPSPFFSVKWSKKPEDQGSNGSQECGDIAGSPSNDCLKWSQAKDVSRRGFLVWKLPNVPSCRPGVRLFS
jgi:hypothetical protein